MTLKQVSIGLDDELAKAATAFQAGHPRLKRGQALALFCRRGVDGISLTGALCASLERYRSMQKFDLTLEQVVDKLLREGLEREPPRAELGFDQPAPGDTRPTRRA